MKFTFLELKGDTSPAFIFASLKASFRVVLRELWGSVLQVNRNRGNLPSISTTEFQIALQLLLI